MFRFLGFLAGSAVSIGAIVWLLGVPRLDVGSGRPGKERLDEMSANDEGASPRPPLSQGARVAERPGAAGKSPTAPAGDAEPAVVGAAAAAGPFHAATGAAEMPGLPEQRWHTFWSPFRSEIAARGFVARLERVTSLDYRVARVKTGVYEVSFAYESDAELERNLSQIHAATGLDLQRR